MINVEFERFWEWLITEATSSEYDNLGDWLQDKFLKWLAEKKPNGWHIYIDDIYDRGYISKEVYKVGLEE